VFIEPLGHDQSGGIGLNVGRHEQPAADNQIVIAAPFPHLPGVLTTNQCVVGIRFVLGDDQSGRHEQDARAAGIVRHRFLLGWTNTVA